MKKAFTAIELIIVIAVLLILMGMLMPAIIGVRERARRRLARRELEGICLALERFFADTGGYPPDTSDYAESGETPGDSYSRTSLYDNLCGPDGKGVQFAGDPRVYGPYVSFKSSQLRAAGSSYEVLDSWGNPYVYEEHRSYFASKDARRKTPEQRHAEAVTRKAHNPMSYDIFSMGSDGLLDSVYHTIPDDLNDMGDEDHETDDVANW